MTLVVVEVPDEAAAERLRLLADVRVVGVVVPFVAATESSGVDSAGTSKKADQTQVETKQLRDE